MHEAYFYPLTSPQLSIWYTEQTYPGTSISNVAGTMRIKERADFDAMEKAINLSIKVNDGMRIRICRDKEGKPQQYIAPYEYKHIEYLDFSKAQNPIEMLYEWDKAATRKPFDIEDSDLFRFAMIKLAEADACFFVNIHHIIADAWSLTLLTNMVMDFYYKIVNGERLDISQDLYPSYISFIESEKQYHESNRFIKDSTFWSQQFYKTPELTVLKSRKSKSGRTVSKRKTYITPVKFIEKLKSYCAENSMSPYPLFLSALAAYINRVTGKYEEIKKHPKKGARILSVISMFRDVVPIVRSHHERIDGKGYPDGLSGDEVPFMSRVVSVADAFDAMMSDRRYRSKLDLESAISQLQGGAGTQFDAKVVEKFVSMLEDYQQMEAEIAYTFNNP
mgnify:CR=1 FL=1